MVQISEQRQIAKRYDPYSVNILPFFSHPASENSKETCQVTSIKDETDKLRQSCLMLTERETSNLKGLVTALGFHASLLHQLQPVSLRLVHG